ncbi:MAG: adenylate/guanylate cyclase domain-containing protein [Chloroflexi bacterium]|nr:MAG: adenylate/guanylate cyclase domain-containing protein [Chloroflexota bacterium]TMG37315.1 MAG: adenylate/guanylate cyclase domain-containing protein [Chloroflexota bacterium]
MFTKRQTRQRAVVAGLTALAVLLGAVALATEFFDTTLQTAVYDKAIDLSPAKVKNQVTIVALDDPTITQYGRYPLPRKAYADLIKALKPLSPAVVAFDVGFYDPAADPAEDRALAEAIRDFQTPTDPSQRPGSVILAMQGAGEQELGDHTTVYKTLQFPVPVLRDAASGLGAVNINPDPDGRVRDSQLVITGPDGARYYSLPLVAAARQQRADLAKLRREGDRLILPTPLGDRVMPVDRRGGMSVYYAAPPAPTTYDNPAYPCRNPAEFCVVSLKDVVNGAIDRRLIIGHAVLVGAHSVSAVPDDYPVPNSQGSKMYGVEIWANTAQSIFTNRYPVLKQGFFTTLVQLSLLTLVGMVLVLRWRLYGFFGALVLFLAYVVGGYVLFANQTGGDVGTGAVEVPSLGYLVGAPFWWVVVLGYLLVEEQVAVARTRSTFGRFVTPAVARTIMDREEAGMLSLGGEDRRVTVLFGDIRGFTTISEGMTPATLLGHLNRYFDGMVDIVNRYEGTVNKYNGDNIMVLWGAPLEVRDQAKKAVECALEMQRWIVGERSKGGPDVSFGFGINTGHVVAGFLGAKGRMEYTVIGDTANVASRLTSSDIARRDQVACSAETLKEVGDDVAFIDLGAIPVKGRAEPVQCYQINRLGPIATPNPAPPPEVPIGRAAVAGYH